MEDLQEKVSAKDFEKYFRRYVEIQLAPFPQSINMNDLRKLSELMECPVSYIRMIQKDYKHFKEMYADVYNEIEQRYLKELQDKHNNKGD